MWLGFKYQQAVGSTTDPTEVEWSLDDNGNRQPLYDETTWDTVNCTPLTYTNWLISQPGGDHWRDTYSSNYGGNYVRERWVYFFNSRHDAANFPSMWLTAHHEHELPGQFMCTFVVPSK